jgi:hypothetical protein
MTGRKSRTFELLVAFDEYMYCRFDNYACKRGIKRASLYNAFASRSIKTAVFIESYIRGPPGQVVCSVELL